MALEYITSCDTSQLKAYQAWGQDNEKPDEKSWRSGLSFLTGAKDTGTEGCIGAIYPRMRIVIVFL